MPTDTTFDYRACEVFLNKWAFNLNVSTYNLKITVKFDYAGACHKINPQTTTALNPTPTKVCIPPKGYNINTLTS